MSLHRRLDRLESFRPRCTDPCHRPRVFDYTAAIAAIAPDGASEPAPDPCPTCGRLPLTIRLVAYDAHETGGRVPRWPWPEP